MVYKLKKSWLRFILEIAIGMSTVLLSLIFLFHYLNFLYTDDKDVVITQILKIEWNVFLNSLVASILFCTIIYIVPYFVIKQGINRRLLDPLVKEKIEGSLAKLSIIVFILLLSITGLNESQFSLFTGFLAFCALLRAPFFKE